MNNLDVNSKEVYNAERKWLCSNAGEPYTPASLRVYLFFDTRLNEELIKFYNSGPWKVIKFRPDSSSHFLLNKIVHSFLCDFFLVLSFKKKIIIIHSQNKDFRQICFPMLSWWFLYLFIFSHCSKFKISSNFTLANSPRCKNRKIVKPVPDPDFSLKRDIKYTESFGNDLVNWTIW